VRTAARQLCADLGQGVRPSQVTFRISPLLMPLLSTRSLLVRLVLCTGAVGYAGCDSGDRATRLVAGDRIVDGSLLASRVDTMVMLGMGRVDESISTIRITDDRRFLERVEVSLRGKIRDRYVLEYPSLSPVLDSAFTPMDHHALHFRGRRVTGEIGTASQRMPVDVTLPTAPFYSNSIDLIIGSLPLSDGYRALVPTFSGETRSITWMRVIAGPIEVVRTYNGDLCRARRVVVRSDSHAIYWIAERTRMMVRWQQVSPPSRLDGYIARSCPDRTEASP
jgi:hypothetical protein